MLSTTNQTNAELVTKYEQELDSLARAGLESTFIALKETGTRTTFNQSETRIGTSQLKNKVTETCDYFPRTDDSVHAQTNDSIGDYRFTDFKFDPQIDPDEPVSSGCNSSRPADSKLSPPQLNRYSNSSWSATNSDMDDPSTLRNVAVNTELRGATSKNFQSNFPWERLRDQNVMNTRYSDDDIHLQLNQCALASNLQGASEAGNRPKYWFRFEQEMDGLGQTWLDLTHPDPSENIMNVYEDGVTLEAKVWMANTCNAKRIWIRVFDIGRGQGDGTILLAFMGTSGKLAAQLSTSKNCNSPTETKVHKNCRQQLVSTNNALVSFPTNTHSPNTTASCSTSLDEMLGDNNNSNDQDLWAYIGMTIDPADADGNGTVTNSESKLRIYMQCFRTSGRPVNNSICNQGTAVAGKPGLRLRLERSIPWLNDSNPSKRDVFRRPWVGKSHWLDDDLRGKMRDLRIWDRTLEPAELNNEITASNTTSDSLSSVFGIQRCNAGSHTSLSSTLRDSEFIDDNCVAGDSPAITLNDTARSLRISPIYEHGSNKLLQFTVKEQGLGQDNVWRLVSCAWNSDPKAFARVTKSLRFQVVGDNEPKVIEILPF